MTTPFEERMAALVRDGVTPSLDQLGGLDGIPAEATTSPIFPLVAAAIVHAYPKEVGMPDAAADLVVDAVTNTTSGLALGDICSAVVPAAGSGVAARLKDALRHRTSARGTPVEAGMAATALQALCHLAVLDDSARPALLDVLTAVAAEGPEDDTFAVAAARVSGIVFDHWRDATAVRCLERLTGTEADADAWFALAHSRLVEALEQTTTVEITAGLRQAVEPFARAVREGEDRPDARMYVAVVLFLSAWSDGAPAAELQPHLDEAGEAVTAFWFDGIGLPERYGWYRPRFDAELRWIDLLRLMHTVAAAEDRDAWYQPPMVLGAFADALEAARTLRPAVSAVSGGDVTGLGHLVEPRLATPFLREVASLGWLERWLVEHPGTTADRLREAVRRQVDEGVTRGKGPAGELSAVAEALGVETVSGEADEVLVRLNQALLDRRAIERARSTPVVTEAVQTVVTDLVACADFAGEVRQRFEFLVEKIVLFLHSRMNAQRGSAGGRMAYLFDPGALEVDLAVDLKSWLEGNYQGTVLAEVREIGGGRTDLIVQCDNFRLVIELKRELGDASRQALRGYLPQVAAYEATDVALGMLVVLDLTPKPTAPANIRDNIWVDVVDGPNEEDRPRFVVAIRVPGNRLSPSEL